MKARRPGRPRLLTFAGGDRAGVVSAVFDLAGAARPLHFWIAVVAVVAVMVVFVAWASAMSPRTIARRAALPKMTVELLDLPSRPPSEAPPAVASPSRAPRQTRPSRPVLPVPQAPAQAAQVVAQEAPAAEALDLTAFTIATGSGPSYAGGKTSSNGTGTHAVTGAVSATGVADGTGTEVSDLSQGVGLRDSDWDCPWPAEADTLGIDEQTVVLRVTVRADGSVESAQPVSDPGSGFGAAALGCARQTRFEPARNRAGVPVRARSGPVRVHFTR